MRDDLKYFYSTSGSFEHALVLADYAYWQWAGPVLPPA